MGGKRITPDEMTEAAKVLAKTGNVSEAARAIGVSPFTMRDAFKRERIATNRHLHAQACEKGLRVARKQTDRIAGLLDKLLDPQNADASSLGLEPGDIARLVSAFNGTTSQRIALADRIERRVQAKLTREKTRAEIELLKRKISGEHVDRVAVEMTDEDLDRRIRELAPVAVVSTDEGSTH